MLQRGSHPNSCRVAAWPPARCARARVGRMYPLDTVCLVFRRLLDTGRSLGRRRNAVIGMDRLESARRECHGGKAWSRWI